MCNHIECGELLRPLDAVICRRSKEINCTEQHNVMSLLCMSYIYIMFVISIIILVRYRLTHVSLLVIG